MNLDKNKKSQYHSALVHEGEMRVKVLSDVLTSKYREKGESGHLYVKLEHDGYEFAYGGENEDCAKAFEGHRGETITIKASGRGEDATISIVGVTEKTTSGGTTQSSARPNPPGVSTPPPGNKTSARASFHQELARTQNALYFIKEAVGIQNENSKINGIETPDAQRQAEIMSTFIKLDRAGLIEELPFEPVWKNATPTPEGEEW